MTRAHAELCCDGWASADTRPSARTVPTVRVASSSSSTLRREGTFDAKGKWRLVADPHAPGVFVVSPPPTSSPDRPRARRIACVGSSTPAISSPRFARAETAESSGTPIDPSVLGVRADGTSSARSLRGSASGPRRARPNGSRRRRPRVRGYSAATPRVGARVFHFAHARAGASRAYLPTENPRCTPRRGVRGCAARLLGRAADGSRDFGVRAIVAAAAVGVPALVAAAATRIGDAADAHAPSRRKRTPRNAGASDSSEISSFDSSSRGCLKEALAELYLADGQRERALALHLEPSRPRRVGFIALSRFTRGGEGSHPGLLGDAGRRRARRRFSSTDARRPAGRRRRDARGRRRDGRRGRGVLHLYLRALFAARIRRRPRRARCGARARGSTPNSTRRNCSFLRRATG